MQFPRCKNVLKYVCNRVSAFAFAGRAYTAFPQIAIITILFSMEKFKVYGYGKAWTTCGNFFCYTVKNFRKYTESFLKIIRICYGTGSVDMVFRKLMETRLISVHWKKVPHI